MSKNLNTILPFYSAVSEQNRYKEYVDTRVREISVGGGITYDVDKDARPVDRLFGFVGRLIPWTIRVPRTYATFTYTVKLISGLDSGLDLTSTLSSYITTVTDTSYHYITFYATADMSGYLTGTYYYVGGEYHLLVEVTQNSVKTSYYSEQFTILPDTQAKYYTKIEWYSTVTRAGIYANAKQFFYVDNLFKTPEYPREDEGTKVDGIMVLEKQISQKAMKLRLLLAPEFMIDAVMMIPLADVVEITEGVNDEKAGISTPTAECWVPQQITVKDPEWNEERKGAVAKLELMFIKYTIVKRLNFSDMPCSCAGGTQPITKSGTVSLSAGVEATITFTTAFATTNYSFTGRCYNSTNDVVLWAVTAQAVGSVKVKALEDSTLMWTAIAHSNV